MKRRLLVVVASLFLLGTGLARAGDFLVFPKTEAEIVDVLKQQNGKPIFVIGGKTIYLIEGKRPQDDLDNAPRAGALIHFDFDSARIRSESYPLLDEFGKALKGGLADAQFVIGGHTDSYGPEAYNLGLSERRAKAVREYLIKNHGINDKRLTIKAYGESAPIAPNDTDENRQLNRRVEFIRVGDVG